MIRSPLPASPADWDTVRLEADACTVLITALTTNTALAMPAPWAYADLGSAVRRPNFDVDARSPRPVTFRSNPGAAGNQTLYLAAISTGDEAISVTAGRVRDLVRTDAHLAARIVKVG